MTEQDPFKWRHFEAEIIGIVAKMSQEERSAAHLLLNRLFKEEDHMTPSRKLSLALCICALVFGSIITVSVVVTGKATMAHAASPSWNEIWSDEFSGSANT